MFYPPRRHRREGYPPPVCTTRSQTDRFAGDPRRPPSPSRPNGAEGGGPPHEPRERILPFFTDPPDRARNRPRLAISPRCGIPPRLPPRPQGEQLDGLRRAPPPRSPLLGRRICWGLKTVRRLLKCCCVQVGPSGSFAPERCRAYGYHSVVRYRHIRGSLSRKAWRQLLASLCRRPACAGSRGANLQPAGLRSTRHMTRVAARRSYLTKGRQRRQGAQLGRPCRKADPNV